MITIPKKVEYAIVFVAYLAKKQGKSVSLSDAARVLNLPNRFLAQIASTLKQAEIITSKEGKTGGYEMAAGFEKKSVYDLVEALGENKGLVECLTEEGKCQHGERCRIRKIWSRMEKSIESELKKIKLSEI